MDKGRPRGFVEKTPARKAGELLGLNRIQLRLVIGLITGHGNLKHTYIHWGWSAVPGVTGSSRHLKRLSHVLCERAALTTVRFRHLGRLSKKPGDFEDISVSRIMHFVEGGYKGCTKDQVWSKCMVNNTPACHIFHSALSYMKELSQQ